MFETIMAVAAVSGLALTSALAQQTTPPASSPPRAAAAAAPSDAEPERVHHGPDRARPSSSPSRSSDQHLARSSTVPT